VDYYGQVTVTFVTVAFVTVASVSVPLVAAQSLNFQYYHAADECVVSHA
jgi:hypothetical protein